MELGDNVRLALTQAGSNLRGLSMTALIFGGAP